MKDYKVDLLFYVNNYDEIKFGLEIFDVLDDVVKVFEEGKWKVKGIISEVGMIFIYFVNLFGFV